MSLLGFIVLAIITAIVGSIGQLIGGYSRGGCLASLVIGFIGAYLGTWLAGQLGLPPIFVITIDGEPFPVVWAIIGSAIFAAILAFLYRGRTYRAFR
jgi:uncharacterized membrane protein YeaQ/YmgE (transglycosylase-associated protein family)